MGWFWADNPRPLSALPPRHPPLSKDASPPPACPMNKSDTKTSSSSSSSPSSSPPNSFDSLPSACPVKSTDHPLRKLAQSQPQSSLQPQPSPTASSPPPSTISKYNPLNYIPAGLTNTAAPSQQHTLPLDRDPSSIPRGDTNSNWEYPSPQQMYNAMLRKGYTDTDVTAVESMVAVHNFLNEGAWSEILEWEHIFAPGLSHAWDICRKGEQGIAQERARRAFAKARREALGLKDEPQTNRTGQSNPDPKLLRFQGFPQTPTPKARILTLLGMAFPASFSSDPPFDRHDWYVERRLPDGSRKEVRYVIDYYSGGEQEGGEQVFYLDIRPALDSPTAAAERAMRWGGDVWYRASGATAREKEGRR